VDDDATIDMVRRRRLLLCWFQWRITITQKSLPAMQTKFTRAIRSCREKCSVPELSNRPDATPCVFSEKAVQQLYDLLDTDGDGFISAEEIVAMLSHCTHARSTHLKFCFKLFDRDNSGYGATQLHRIWCIGITRRDCRLNFAHSLPCRRYLEPMEFAHMIRTIRRNAGAPSPKKNERWDDWHPHNDPFLEHLALALHDFHIR